MYQQRTCPLQLSVSFLTSRTRVVTTGAFLNCSDTHYIEEGKNRRRNIKGSVCQWNYYSHCASWNQNNFEVSCFSFVNLPKELTCLAVRWSSLYSVCAGAHDLVSMFFNWMTYCFEKGLLISECWGVVSSPSSLKCQDNKWLDVEGDRVWDCQILLPFFLLLVPGDSSFPGFLCIITAL